MSEDLKRYNHLKYSENPPHLNDKDDFIDFLLSNSDISCPEIDENKAWDSLNHKIAQRNKAKGSNWLKIAASIAILLSLSIALVLFNSDPSQIQVVSNNDSRSITFPDGSLGVLNQHSRFSYPEKFGNERKVSFVGEAYFDIVKSEKPFVIDANGVEVKVLGTAFNLITTKNDVRLFVERGLVAFSKDGSETMVAAGKEAIFDRSTNDVTVKSVPANNIMSWRNGTFRFENTPLAEALEDLSKYYRVEFKLSNQNLESCRISASIDDKSLKEVIALVETILDVNVKVKGDLVKISGKGC